MKRLAICLAIVFAVALAAPTAFRVIGKPLARLREAKPVRLPFVALPAGWRRDSSTSERRARTSWRSTTWRGSST